MTTYPVPLQIWATGDVSLADGIFAKDVSLYNLVYGACLSCTLCCCNIAPVSPLVMFAMLHQVLDWYHLYGDTVVAFAGGEKEGLDTFKSMVSNIFKVSTAMH